MATKRFVLGAISAFLLALLVACGGGGGGTDTTPPPVVDDIRPTVKSVTPADGATGVEPTVAIVAVLSEPMVCTSGATKIAMKVNGQAVEPIDAAQVCVADKPDTFQFIHLANFPSGSLTLTLSGLRDLAGNSMVDYSWTVGIVSPKATVTLGATPDAIVAGQSTTLTWTATNAANCVGSGGLSGSLSPTGGTLTVSPTVTTTYGIECRNADNLSTGVVNQVVTVTPAPVKLEYTDVVVAIWPQFPDWPGDTSGIVRIDRNSPKGYLPNKNLTGKQFYFTGIRPVPRADCLMELSSLDTTGADIRVLYNLKTGEQTLDTSAAGAAWNRVTDYRYSTVWDPAYPLWSSRATVSDGTYYILDTEHENLYFQSNVGVVTQVIKSTFAATGGINGIWTYSCKAQ